MNDMNTENQDLWMQRCTVSKSMLGSDYTICSKPDKRQARYTCWKCFSPDSMWKIVVKSNQ